MDVDAIVTGRQESIISSISYQVSDDLMSSEHAQRAYEMRLHTARLRGRRASESFGPLSLLFTPAFCRTVGPDMQMLLTEHRGRVRLRVNDCHTRTHAATSQLSRCHVSCRRLHLIRPFVAQSKHPSPALASAARLGGGLRAPPTRRRDTHAVREASKRKQDATCTPSDKDRIH